LKLSRFCSSAVVARVDGSTTSVPISRRRMFASLAFAQFHVLDTDNRTTGIMEFRSKY
jgi:hypothetical protein